MEGLDTEALVRRAARDRGKPLTYSWDLACARSDDLETLLSRLLYREAQQRCDQCGAGDCTHQAASLVLGERLESLSWDDQCAEGYSYQGYGLDELLRKLLIQEARYWCGQCGAKGCTHAAARLVLTEIAAAEGK